MERDTDREGVLGFLDDRLRGCLRGAYELWLLCSISFDVLTTIGVLASRYAVDEPLFNLG